MDENGVKKKKDPMVISFIVVLCIIGVVALSTAIYQGFKNKKRDAFLIELDKIINTDVSIKPYTDEDCELRELVHKYFKDEEDLRDWCDAGTTGEFDAKFSNVIADSFTNHRNTLNYLKTLQYLNSVNYKGRVGDGVSIKIKEYIDGDVNKALEMYNEGKKVDVGEYFEYVYKLKLTTDQWNTYDTSGMTVSEIYDVNFHRNDLVNVKVGEELHSLPITQKSVDISKEGLTFKEKLQLVDDLENYGCKNLKVFSANDIVEEITNHSEPVYTKQNQGGYYDTHKVKEYHFNESQDMKDIITYNGEACFANTIDASYMGDFASQTFKLEYVDYDDNYAVKDDVGWYVYFRGTKLDVTPERFRAYADFYYADDYLFACTENSIDVYDSLGSLVLKVVGAEEEIKALRNK